MMLIFPLRLIAPSQGYHWQNILIGHLLSHLILKVCKTFSFHMCYLIG